MVTVDWAEGKVRFIDQTRLPEEEVCVETADYRVVEEAIRSLRIRGAPAIGVAAAFGVCLAVFDARISSVESLRTEFYDALNALAGTRPTAVNLFTALGRMRRTFESASPSTIRDIRARLLAEAHAIRQEDVDACAKIGKFGAALLLPGSTVLTHCNAGALATAGIGTALCVITTAADLGRIDRVFVDETRPRFQGARLTAWELVRHGIDTILITDSTSGLLLQQREISAVVVGADRIAANGDIANKIGTYPLAVLASRHQTPFYVAAPLSTVDLHTEDGRHIPIEERNPSEITHVAGKRIAAEGVRVFAPAFDITPHELITAIVTERGVLKPPFGPALADLFAGSRPAGPEQS